MNDTIAAISTALGVGAISIIRVSGKEAIPIVNEIFRGKDLNQVPTHTIHYGFIEDQTEILDEVLVSVMKAPKTFTVEDVVEINCHGGIQTTKRILECLLLHGVRLAEPGEFTKRAFLNGRIDLTQAEGVMDLIEAKTDQARQHALGCLSGKVSNCIRLLRQKIVELLANIEVNIDYPEYEDITEMTNELLLSPLREISREMRDILKHSENGVLLQNGIRTAIVGRPNVGKSSLLNLLLEQDKAIVTDIAGTTRDIVEGTVFLDGLLLNMIDTAGIRETTDLVEELGVKKSKEVMESADLVLFVLNGNEPLTLEEEGLLKAMEGRPYLIIINKIDLEQVIDLSGLPPDRLIFLSTKTEEGLDNLKEAIQTLFQLDELEQQDVTYLSNARSIALLKQAIASIDTSIEGIVDGFPIDMVELDMKAAWNFLGEIIGETYQDELINQLFSQFCLGK